MEQKTVMGLVSIDVEEQAGRFDEEIVLTVNLRAGVGIRLPLQGNSPGGPVGGPARSFSSTVPGRPDAAVASEAMDVHSNVAETTACFALGLIAILTLD